MTMGISFLARISLFTLLLFLQSFDAGSQAKNFCGVKNTTAYDGEIISYHVYYSLAGIQAKAATVTFSTQLEKYQGKVVYHFKGQGGTLSSYDWFFKVRDVYESYVDTSNMMPLKFRRDIQEGKNKFFNQALFNYTSQQILSTNKSIELLPCTQDVLSAIYYARNIDFTKYKANDKIPFNLYLDDKIYPIYLRYLGKQNLKIAKKNYPCIVFKPLLIDGTIFTGGEDMKVFVTDDKRKIPIYIETPILVGKIKVFMKN
jgi:hypothetical protein